MFSPPGYKIISCLHEGTSSIIYKALRESSNEAVVIKISTQRNENYIQRFQHEFVIGRQLINSPYVIHYHELKQDPAYGIALIMEDNNAVDLATAIPTHGFSDSDFLKIAIQITKGLKDIHGANIIHNDIKPSNILIQKANNTIKIIDFDQASTLQQEMQPAASIMMGSLDYISPEQTGRINRRVDYRTDFYSLGVTFYHLLCGQLPFTGKPVARIHQHLAKQPKPPHSYPYKSDIALPLSLMIMKLLEKEAENRYQSCEGILYDLESCLSALNKTGHIPDNFKLGTKDFSSTLLLSQHLYGRKHEVQTLCRTLERICYLDKPEVIMVTGQAGIGKTMLIQEVQRPITLKQGYFSTGKFDQLNKNVAYSALTQAFNNLINQILTEPEESITQWKNRMIAALGSHAQLIIKVVPTLTSLIGKESTVTITDISQTKNVFNLAFQEFVSALADAKHPLVIFLDDLQWADSASLELMVYLLQQPKVNHLLWIGAYRDNEVTPIHPAMQAIEDLREAQVNLQTLTLEPLRIEHLCQWIADSLHMPQEEVSNFAELIQRKTAGNPFFVKRFLQLLYTEQLLYFSEENRSWQWKLKEICEHPATENVITLMTYQIKQLPPTTQKTLSIASCIGHRLTLSILQTAMDCSFDAVYEALQPALNSGILIKTDGEVHFTHDRIQEAAYRLLDEVEKPHTHLTIGKRLLTHLTSEKTWLFDTVAQFNQCRELINEPNMRLQIVRLNLEAGQKAKSTAAFLAALQYLHEGLAWADQETLWETDYPLAFTLYKELAEMEYLCGHLDSSQTIIANMQPRLQFTLDKIDICHLLIIQKIMLGQLQEAIMLGHEALQLLGNGLPLEKPTEFTQSEIPLLKEKLANTSFSSLLDRPRIEDSEKKAICMILADLASVCYQTGSNLLSAITLMAINMSLSYGHTPESCVSYAVYGLLLCTDYQEYALGYKFGNLAIQLAEKLHSSIQRCRSKLYMLNFVYPWSKPINTLPALLTSASEESIACGEIEYASYCRTGRVLILFDLGVYLATVQQEIIAILQFVQSTKTRSVIYNITRGTQKVVANLMGDTQNETDFNYNNLSDIEFVADCQKTASGLPLGLYYIRKAQALYLYGEFKEALECINLARDNFSCVRGFYATTAFNWYDSLSRLALYPNVPSEMQQVHQNQQQMQLWCASCPENFEHKYLLIEAELARLNNDYMQAETYYNQAIELAGKYGFVQEQALAAELAANYWLLRNVPLCAQGYLNLALNGYKQWGAKRKLMQFKARYAHLLQALAPLGLSQLVVNQETTFSGNTLKFLDLSSILKSSQVISSGIELANLLRNMMQIIIENAGAQQGALLFMEADDSIIVQAEFASDGTISTLQKEPLAQWTHGAHTVIQYVKKLHQTVIVNDANKDERFMTDVYMRQNQIKSILCVPILKHTELKAILYVENNLMSFAFTAERVQTVQILTGQMAISLENAMLYDKARSLSEQLNLSLESANIGIWNLNLQTNEVTADERLLALWGINRKEFESTYNNFMTMIHPDDRASVEQAIKLAIENNQLYDTEFRVIYPDKSIHTLAGRAEIYRNNNGEAIRMVGVTWDITQRKQLEQERLEALKQAKEKDHQHLKEQEEFIDTACHEVRNPMVGIFGHVEFLKQTANDLKAIKGNLPASIQPAIDEPIYRIEESTSAIEQCVKHQKTIIDDVLDLSKLETGKVTLRAIPFQPKQLIEETLQIFTLALSNKHLSLHLSLPEQDVVIKSDPDRFKMILMNLISNAIKFTEQGQITIELRINYLESNQVYLELCIKDTGIGIKPEQQQSLFQRFSRPVSSQYEGSGLGLVITKNIVDLMEGTIEVTSEEGKGSQFKIYLTCEAQAPQERKTPSSPPTMVKEASKPEEIPNTPKKKSILIAEDNIINQKVLQRQLEQAGYQCSIANNGLEAVTAWESRIIDWINKVAARENSQLPTQDDRFDLILMDKHMPDKDGIEATKEIRLKEKQLGIEHKTPIIGLSAFTRQEFVNAAEGVGMNDYLTKPCPREILIQKIIQWTSQSIPVDKSESTTSPPSPSFFARAPKASFSPTTSPLQVKQSQTDIHSFR